MKVTAEKIPQSQVVLNIEADPAEVEQSKEKAYRRLVQRANIPGFRKGKAPRSMLERYLGPAMLLEEAVNLLIPEATDKAIKEQSIEPVGQPDIEVVKLEPVSWKATVPVKPVVELGNYKELRVESEPVVVADEQVNTVIDEIRFQQTPWEPVERAVAFGDLVTLDMQATQDGKTVGDEKGSVYRVEENSQVPVPGFSKELVGLGKGETKEFKAAFPADYERAQLAGKEYQFKVTIQEVKAKNLPELNDDFAKSIGDKYETIEQLRSEVSGRVRKNAEAEAKAKLEDKALAELVKQAQLEYPPQLVEHELQHMLSEQEEQLKQNKVSMSDYLARIGKTGDQLKEELKPVAVDRVARTLVVARLIELEGIKVSDEEINAEIEVTAASAGQSADELRRIFSTETGKESVGRVLVRRKALDRLVAVATGAEAVGNPANPERGTL